MKKIITALVLMLISTPAWALFYKYSPSVLNTVDIAQKVYYSPVDRTWSRDEAPKDIKFMKFVTVGSGSYSEYQNKDKKYETNTTYEFLSNKKLYGYNMHTLKFYELTFDKDKFSERVLTPKEVQAYFPDVQIVKVSEFKNNKITLEKPFFKKKFFLLLNDTDKDFYKYQFENSYSNAERIHGIFEATRQGVINYSHFKSRDKMFPVLEIRIVNVFDKKTKEKKVSK